MHSDENYMKLSWINPEHGAVKFATNERLHKACALCNP